MDMFLEESEREFRPRVLELDLDAWEGPGMPIPSTLTPWSHPDPLLNGVGAISGSALSLSMVLAKVRAGEPPGALILSVGSAVRRRLPTAARATVAGISPLTGIYTESQVGGGLAGRMLQLADALSIRGKLPETAGACLVVGAGGEARIERLPELASLPLPERCALLRTVFPGAGGLCIGEAGQRQVPFASLATLGDPPSFTGRGGLGANLGGTGLVALVVDMEQPPEGERATNWSAALADSPHLRSRGAGGTFELHDAFAARGDLPANPAARSGFADTLANRQSCPGCPTACRHVLKSGDRQLAGRFSATHPLGPALGLDRVEDQLALLEACNGLGLDAGEVGATLAVWIRVQREAGEPDLAGNREGLLATLQGICRGTLSRGAEQLARANGLAEETPTVRGSAMRPVSDLAARLGQCVSLRGSDSMRAFPFLSENGGDMDRLAALVAPLELPVSCFDSKNPDGKGRLVWWHENLANAVDASGFCAFSAAGLLGDGFGTLDDLAGWLDLPGLRPGGEALAAMGATLVLLQRELAERLGQAPGADLPEWTRPALEQPGMWDEYRQLRGLDADGQVESWARAALGTTDLLRTGREGLRAVQIRVDVPRPVDCTQGSVFVAALDPLAATLDGAGQHTGLFPMTVGTLMRELANAHPAGAAWLWQNGSSAVSVYRETRRLAPHDLVRDGDRLDLVVAISGG